MFNKNFFLGMLTTLVVVVILAVGGLVAFGAARPGAAGFMEGSPGGRFEQQFNPGGDQFGGRPDGGFRGERGEHGHGEFSPLRGLGGILGSLLIIGLVVGAVVGGQWAYRRLRGQPAPPVVNPPAGKPSPFVADATGPDDADLAEPTETLADADDTDPPANTGTDSPPTS